jgi:hypothetical protein
MKSAKCSIVFNAFEEMGLVDKVVVTEVILNSNEVASLLGKPGVPDSQQRSLSFSHKCHGINVSVKMIVIVVFDVFQGIGLR